MRKQLIEIKQCLECTLEEFSDAYINYEHDLENETYQVQQALNKVNELLFSSSVGRFIMTDNKNMNFKNSA